MSDAESFVLNMDLLRSRIRDLPPEAKAVFALACAQRLVRGSSGAFASLDDALDAGWSMVLFGRGDCAAIRRELESREDLDADPVAAVTYALGAVDGAAEDAWWATSRLVDDAFARVPYPDDATFFRPVEEDAQHETVRHEFQWIDASLGLLESEDALSSVIERLRM